jgi:hypothetical protein
LHRQDEQRRVREDKARRGLKIIGLCVLVALIGVVRRAGCFLATRSPDFAEVSSAGITLALGMVGIAITVFQHRK